MRVAIGLALGVSIASAASAQPAWVHEDLGTLGGTVAVAQGINDRGHVVGYSTTANGEEHAFLWTPATGMQDLGMLGGQPTRARAINNRGWVVGSSTTRAFLWTPEGGIVDLFAGEANDINDAGQIVGRCWGCGVINNARAVLWTATEGLVDLGTIPGLPSFSAEATGINNLGHIAGTYRWSFHFEDNFNLKSFLWTPANGMVDLGLPNRTTVSDINDRDQLVGTCGLVWTPSDGPTYFSAGAGTCADSSAISSAGQAVGELVAGPTRSSRGPFVWTETGGVVPLDASFAPFRRWARASAINAAGHIAGSVDLGTGTAAVLWRPREDLVVDFGSSGTWLRAGATWTAMPVGNPLSTVTGDLDGNGTDDLVMNYGPGVGLWAWMNHSVWLSVYPLSPSQMVVGDFDGDHADEIVMVFPGVGTWLWRGGSFVPLAVGDAAHLAVGRVDAEAGEDLVLDFPGVGIYLWLNGSTWTLLHGENARGLVTADLDGTGQDEVVVDFAGWGLWVYRNASTWTPLHGLSAAHLAAGDLDGNGRTDLVIDFGPAVGLWTYRNDASWAPLHGLSAESVLLADLDGSGQLDVVIDFGPAYGLWQYANDRTWTSVHGLSPERVAAGRFQ